MADTNTSKLPVSTFRDGMLKLSVWENQSKEGRTFYALTFERRFQDKDEKWQSTTSVPLNLAPRVARLYERAFDELQIVKETPTKKTA